MVPINLINEIKDVGFDYYMSPRDVAEGVLSGHMVLWEYDFTLKRGIFRKRPEFSDKSNER